MTVSPLPSEHMKAILDKVGVRAILEECPHAPHGFGDGTGTDAEGWPERAIAFLKQLGCRDDTNACSGRSNGGGSVPTRMDIKC